MEVQTDQTGIKAELAAFNSEMKNKASRRGDSEGKSKEGNEEILPAGSSSVAASGVSSSGTEIAPAEEANGAAGNTGGTGAEEKTELIRIGDKEFKTASEAIKYAEKLEYDKLVSEAYNQGIRDHMQTLKPAAAPEEPEDDKFEERFYANPKETLKELKEQAKREALAVIQAEARKESLWNQFFDENPDLAGQRSICEHVLQQNWDTIGAMTDVPKAMKILATKTRAIFQDYAERTKPRTELTGRNGQAVSAGVQAQSQSVTQPKKADEPLTITQQLRKLRERG